MHIRTHSVAVAGGSLGDEGKGRITDELTSRFLQTHDLVIHYRDNGGANAGHTVLVDGKKVVLHQLSSGVLQKGCVCILGKDMVLHPEDLVAEIQDVHKATGKKRVPAKIMIELLASTALDTHRAFEGVLKTYFAGKSTGSTGRGISPAYADLLYRHPVRMRDLVAPTAKETLRTHYRLYQKLMQGFGADLAKIEVCRLDNSVVTVSSERLFINRILTAVESLRPYITDTQAFITKHWAQSTPFVFEKAQALGLDGRWGVYPDITASNCGFDGIHSSTEGLIAPEQIQYKFGTIKATYTSSVGSRVLPTTMDPDLAHRIREDANEYGSTTRRPRGIVHIDIPMIRYLVSRNKVTHLAVTHLDISYLDQPIKVCTSYTRNGKTANYRPDQEYLNEVKPVYKSFEPWDGVAVRGVSRLEKLPPQARAYLKFLEKELGIKLGFITTGAERSETIFLLPPQK